MTFRDMLSRCMPGLPRWAGKAAVAGGLVLLAVQGDRLWRSATELWPGLPKPAALSPNSSLLPQLPAMPPVPPEPEPAPGPAATPPRPLALSAVDPSEELRRRLAQLESQLQTLQSLQETIESRVVPAVHRAVRNELRARPAEPTPAGPAVLVSDTAPPRMYPAGEEVRAKPAPVFEVQRTKPAPAGATAELLLISRYAADTVVTVNSTSVHLPAGQTRSLRMAPGPFRYGVGLPGGPLLMQKDGFVDPTEKSTLLVN